MQISELVNTLSTIKNPQNQHYTNRGTQTGGQVRCFTPIFPANTFPVPLFLVQFTDGITHSDLDIRQWGNDLVAFMQGTPDAIKITDWFADDRNKVSQFQFADGNVWDTATITEAANAKSAVMSGSGNLIGGTGDDIFINDSNAPCTMTGGAGNDIYYWMPINDATIVNSTNGTDMGSDSLQINTDLADLGWNRSGSDLQLTSDSHTLTIQNWFSGSGYQVDNLQFADGSSFSNTVINQKILNI